jgi:hypothetical protein
MASRCMAQGLGDDEENTDRVLRPKRAFSISMAWRMRCRMDCPMSAKDGHSFSRPPRSRKLSLMEYLHVRAVAAQDGYDAIGHFRVERIIGGEGHDIVLSGQFLHLEPGRDPSSRPMP